MPVDLIADLAAAVLDLLRMALMAAIPAFLLALAGARLHKMLAKKFRLEWIQSVFASTFIILLPIVFTLYLAPYYLALIETPPVGAAPGFAATSMVEYGLAFFLTIAKNIITAFVFALLLLPLIFLGAFISEILEKRTKLKGLPNNFAAVYLTALIAWMVVFFVFPWIYPGLLYLLFWGSL